MSASTIKTYDPIILCDTAGMTNEEWLAARKHGPNGDIPVAIGGSDASIVFRINPWTSILDLWMDKTGIQPIERLDGEMWQLEMGHLMEPLVVEAYKMKNRQAVKEGLATVVEVFEDTNLYQSGHPNRKYALANLDRVIKRDGKFGVLECKNTTYYKADNWVCGTPPYYRDGQCPLYYELQCRFYMAVKNLWFTDICCVWGNGPKDTAIVGLERDLEYEEMMFEELDLFVQDVINKVKPSLVGTKSKLAYEALKRSMKIQSKSDMIELPLSYLDTIERICSLQAAKTVASKEVDEIDNKIDELFFPIAEKLGLTEIALLEPDENTAYQIKYGMITRQNFNSKQLAIDDPAVYEKYASASSFRKLTIAKYVDGIKERKRK